ncbi:radical SAM protein [Proteiniborus sp. MB09-C3]|uniref:elongator complex protein 3 n=1 Tax=Proteiniborus sp. MB09-C3 TaxID=3050072 RepID=UPI002554259D|nr:radical SAM protein [Proteiniborus sp. MB09-C3]WIV10832.1 radical SAM protein [Proteiniborus sp. MB09-C3]
MSIKYHIIPIFVPHVGCPHDCIFCNQRKIAQEKANIDGNSIKDTIDSYLSTIPNTNEKLEIAFFGGSFTGIDVESQKKLLEIAYNYKNKGYIDRIRLSTRPDYIDNERLNLLKQYDVDIIELGVQSMCPDVLQNSFRGHSDVDVINASKLIKDYGFTLGLQMMVGLPESNYEKEIFTAKQLIDLNPSIVRIYPTLVIKDTYLEKNFYNGDYIPLSLDEAIEICIDLLMLFNYYDINVIRVGLQPTDNIAKNKDVVAGPFHPAFRQLVEEKVCREYLKIFFKYNTEIKNIQVYINKKEISNFVGQHSSNLKFLREAYGIDKVKIMGKDINKESFFIANEGINYEIKTKELTERYLINKGLVTMN